MQEYLNNYAKIVLARFFPFFSFNVDKHCYLGKNGHF